jgi:hypothetical protein
MKKLYIIILLFISTSIVAQVHSKFTEILKDHLTEGMVNYAALKEDGRLIEYTNFLESINPDTIKNDDLRLAYWINAYNAFTLKIISENYPLESINDLHKGGLILGHILGTTIWDHEFIVINGKELSLNNIEHDIIRKEFKEPRIHFALVCAAISCPLLRNEAYEGDKLNKQLEYEAFKFFRDVERNNFNDETKTAYLSKILSWFEEDFGNNDEEVLRYVANFAPEEFKESLINETDKWDIDYLSYNWDLNDSATTSDK